MPNIATGMQMEATVAKKKFALTFSGDEDWNRLVTQLTLNGGRLNKSETIRQALIEKADRELGNDWRERLGLTNVEAAA